MFKKPRIKPIEVTTGCTQACEFCPIAGETVTTKPLDVVIREIEMIKLKPFDMLFFVDHNLFNLNASYLSELFAYINKRKILWSGEGTIVQQVYNENLMREMAQGCVSFLSGLEDIEGRFEGSPAKQRLVRNFDSVLDLLRKYKFPVVWSMVFGLDSQNPQTFLDTASFIEEKGLDVYCHLIQPRNGSKFQEQLIREGRLLEEDSQFRDGRHLVFEPKQMSSEQTLAGYIWLNRLIGKTVPVRFKKNLKIGGLMYAAALASLELIGDGLCSVILSQMNPALKEEIRRYEERYRSAKT